MFAFIGGMVFMLLIELAVVTYMLHQEGVTWSDLKKLIEEY